MKYESKFERAVDISHKLANLPKGYSIQERILDVLWLECKGRPVIMTATELAKKTASNLASLSSTLKKMTKAGILYRAPAYGERGGYGYYVPYRVPKDRLR